MPIVKFILNSLPLESLIQESELPPKALDYACGAGHFLNELALQIKPFVKKHKQADIKEYYKEIVGVEKEYRLSKVAKVSAFMYGQDEIKITYADALGNKAKLQENEYSILVANPPYAVKGFLQTLSEVERKSFTLFEALDEKSLSNNNSIETFFIEKAKQLLKPNAVAGLILPSSILSNDATIYTKTREIILKYFQIIAIAEFGSQTFGKTGTNTVTLFLRRKEENPAPAEHFKNRVDAWFDSNQTDEIYNDQNLINSYCNHIEIEAAHYKTLLAGNPSDELLKTEMFVDYKKSFENLTEIKNLKKPNNSFSKKPKAEQEAELNRRFTEYLRETEKDKIYFFVLALENKQKVLVVKCPNDNKEQKQFLGYEWSSAKGNEGIKYINQSNVAAEIEDAETKELVQKISGLHNINTPLYNPNNRNDPSKINHYIQESFLGNELAVATGLQPFIAYHNLADMLDFSRVNFNKQIQLNSKKLTAIQSKWELVKLGDLAEVIAGQSPDSEFYNEHRKGLPFYQGKKDFGDIFINNPAVWTSKITKESIKNDILMSVRAPVGDVNINPFEKICIGRGLAAIRTKNLELQKYLFEYISQNKALFQGKTGTTFDSISTGDLKERKIPLPPKEIQQKIVDECAAIDNQAQKAAAEIEKAKTEIKSIINNQLLVGKTKKLADLLDINKFTKDPTQKPDKEFIYVDIESVGKGTGFVSYEQKILGANAPSRARRLAPKGSTIISTVRPNLKGFAFIEKEVEDSIFSTGFAILQSKDEKQLLNKVVYFAFQHSNDLMKQMEASKHGGSYPSINKNDIENLKIPVPPIAEQEKLANQIEKLEQIIAKNQAKIDDAPNNKKAIMKNYL
jgi:restriction endonuclease S subunit/type I restriction-modification system DNA methylase subunit